MKLKDPEAWAAAQAANPPPDGCDYDPRGWPETLTDKQMGQGYGACVIFFAQVWAEEMEKQITDGRSVADVAQVCSSYTDAVLDRWGLTGFQYGAAVSTLAGVWEHGDELRRWHNLDTQLGNEGERANEEGGVLNPALLSFGTSDS